LGEPDPLHHTFRKSAETLIAVRCQANEVEVGGNAVTKLSGSEATETAVEREEFRGGKPVVETKIFGKKSDVAANFDILEGPAEELRSTTSGFDQAKQHFDGRAFAGTVRTEKTENFTAPDLEGKAADGDLGTELFAEADGFDGQVSRRQRILRQVQVALGVGEYRGATRSG